MPMYLHHEGPPGWILPRSGCRVDLFVLSVILQICQYEGLDRISVGKDLARIRHRKDVDMRVHDLVEHAFHTRSLLIRRSTNRTPPSR